MDNNIYFHLHRKGCFDNEWVVGNTIKIDKNAFSEFSYNFTPTVDAYNRNQISVLNVINYSIEIGDIANQLKLLKNSYNIINEYGMLVRELAYEEFRIKKYPNLPSRNCCIWLFRQEQMDYWKKFIGGDIELYKIEVFSNVFKTRNSLISFPNDSYNTIKYKADQYWAYNSSELNEDDEYLYSGEFKIIEKID